jgi:hypothetical protein
MYQNVRQIQKNIVGNEFLFLHVFYSQQIFARTGLLNNRNKQKQIRFRSFISGAGENFRPCKINQYKHMFTDII